MNDNLISVIIPVYNVEKWLESCLNSIINQTYKALEIICIDDCSTDKSYDILQKYKDLDSRIVVIKNKKNMGLGLTRNVGLSIAKGKWVHFVDSDDWLELDAYEKLTAKLNSLDFEPDLLFFSYNKYHENQKKFEKVDFKNKSILNKNLNPQKDIETFDNWDRYAWMKLHRRQFLEDNHIVFKNYRCMEDMEYAALLYTKAQSVCYTDLCCINYRRCMNSLVTQTYKYVDCKFKSIINNRYLYRNLKDELKYKLLGFDYIQLCYDIKKAWVGGYITIFDVLYIILRINTFDVEKFIYENKTLKEANKIIRFYPLFVEKYFNGDKYWYRKIFSIQNKQGKTGKHKCIIILGLKLNIKKRSK